jgi:hypothetical protein
MKRSRLLLVLGLVVFLSGVAYVGQTTEPAGIKMARAAETFLGRLDREQRARAIFPFEDEERLHWHFIPLQYDRNTPRRKGMRLEQMDAEQRAAALDLLRAGTSSDGYIKATTIMSLETILHELEKGGSAVRNPGWYFFTIFGTPSRTGRWGWRVEGHHLSLNFVVDGGKVVSATPAFFGANPAVAKAGPRKGTRVLPEAEDLARELTQTLTDDQRRTARQEKQFPEVQGGSRAPAVSEPKGLPGSKMTREQQALLLRLLESYARRLPADVGESEMSEVRSNGLDQVYFAYAGELKDGSPHTYRIQGPTVLVEFLNVQSDSAGNPANHIHSVWRNIRGDFGLAN